MIMFQHPTQNVTKCWILSNWICASKDEGKCVDRQLLSLLDALSFYLPFAKDFLDGLGLYGKAVLSFCCPP